MEAVNTPNTQIDGGVVGEAKNGNPESLEQVVEFSIKRAFNHCRRRNMQPFECDEVAGQVGLTVLEKLDSFRGEAKFTTWLYEIIESKRKRRYLNAWNKKVILGDHDLNTEDRVSDTALWSHTYSEILRCSESILTEGQLEVFDMKINLGHSASKIAEELGISEGAVKLRYHRALQVIKESEEVLSLL